MFNNDDAPLDASSFRLLVGTVALGAVLSVTAVIATRRFLYADSSYFLLGMWENGSFFVPNYSRWFGFWVTQWLPVLAMKLGLTDLGVLAALYGVNLWMNPALTVLVAWWSSGRSREVTLATLLCVLFLFQNTYLVLDNEASVFFLLVSILLILTLRRDFSYWVLLLFIPILFSHGVAVLAVGPILVALLLWRRRYFSTTGRAGSGPS
jgi:hypothetical protein